MTAPGSKVDYDVVVVGGGIHGVGVAQAAAAAGYSVLALEQDTLASGTSSRSSKLIHGGLRYLETAQFGLVRECLHERALLLKNAPDLVQLKPFYIPVYEQTRRRPLTLTAGLSLYALFTGWHRSAMFRRVPKQQWSDLDGLRTNGLQAVFQYWDAQTDDKRLTRAVMASAEGLGAELWTAAQFVDAAPVDTSWRVDVIHNGSEQSVSCRALVNAAGPWVNQVDRRVEQGNHPASVELVQGTHLVIDEPVTQGIYYVEAPQDGRAVFVMPWYGKLMIGTTERLYHGDPSKVAPSEEEIRYLLDVLERYFPRLDCLNAENCTHMFAGLRVLPKEESEAHRRSRDTVILENAASAPPVLSIYGGKLTAYRATAEKVMQNLLQRLPQRKAVADTKTLTLKPVD